MTKNTDHQDSLLPAFLFSLLHAAKFCTQWTLRPLFFWVKSPMTEACRLKSASAEWSTLKWICQPIQWIAGIYAMGGLLIAIHDIYTGHLLLRSTRQAVMVFATLPLAGLVFMLFDWIDGYSEDPQVRKELAGKRAEETVQKIIEALCPSLTPCATLHGALFVFHPGTSNEYSVEADHILVTPQNLYLVETKHKCGIIHAAPDSPTWKTETVAGQGSMRNALRQAKNSARALERELGGIPSIVPLVAIHGEEVVIVGGPSNVVSAYDLPLAIKAFEFASRQRPALNPSAIFLALQSHVSTDAEDWQRHVARADAARQRAELREIVRTSSVS